MSIRRNNKKKLQNQLGISLVEVIIGMALMLIIVGPIINGLTTGMKSYQYNMAQNQNITAARSSVSSITDELRYASAASISISADEKIINYTVGTENRRIYIGSGDDVKTLIIEYNGSVNKRVAIKKVQAISFKQDATYDNKVNITLQFNDNSYAKSPDLNFTNISVVVGNI